MALPTFADRCRWLPNIAEHCRPCYAPPGCTFMQQPAEPSINTAAVALLLPEFIYRLPEVIQHPFEKARYPVEVE